MPSTVELPAEAKKLAGCVGTPVAALLPKHITKLTHPCGVFTASDGLMTEPITLTELAQGVIVHSTADGAPLPVSMGGPLRVWYPPGVAVQRSPCMTGEGPVNVKAARSLAVHSVDSAAALIVDGEGRALVLQRGASAPWMPLKWTLPGGGIDPRETPEQCAVRECEEAAGLTPLEPQLLGQFEYAPCRRLAVYHTRWRSGRLKINFESAAHAWVSEAELGKYEFVPPMEEALRAAFARGTSAEMTI